MPHPWDRTFTNLVFMWPSLFLLSLQEGLKDILKAEMREGNVM